jgi:hypothetical protein
VLIKNERSVTGVDDPKRCEIKEEGKGQREKNAP